MGAEDATTGRSSGLKAFEAIEDISIVAAPGSTLRDDARSNTIIGALISHAERMQYRIAVVDCARQQTIANVRALRARYRQQPPSCPPPTAALSPGGDHSSSRRTAPTPSC